MARTSGSQAPTDQDRGLWERFLGSNPGPSPDHLEWLVRNYDPLRALAWPLLLKRLSSDPKKATGALTRIARFVPDFRREAWDILKTLDPTIEELCYVMEHVPDLRDDAWEAAQRHLGGPWKPENREPLRGVICKVPELAPRAAKLLVVAGRRDKDLREDMRHVVCWVPELSQEIGLQLLGSDPGEEELLCVMRVVKPLRINAWRIALGDKPSSNFLMTVGEEFPELAEEAGRNLLELDVQSADGETAYYHLDWVAKWVPPLREEALARRARCHERTPYVMAVLWGRAGLGAG